MADEQDDERTPTNMLISCLFLVAADSRLGEKSSKIVNEAAERLRVYEESLQHIIRSEPCSHLGECFYPHHDGEGNFLGDENVDPLQVVQEMSRTARNAIDGIKDG